MMVVWRGRQPLEKNYVNECAFRYNNKNNPQGMFETIIGQVSPITI